MKLTINEEAVKHYHYGNSGESRRKEVADRFGFDFTPDDHMITCKDGKVINIQLGKKYRCTSCNNQRVEIVDIDELFDDGSAMLDVAWRNKRYTVSSTQIYESVLREKDVEIDVKHEGILEVPEGKNVNDLPMSHFEKLAKKKGLGKITKALNNLQVWNKNDDPELSKWAGNMIDKLNKKLKKDESLKISEGYLDYDWKNTYTTRELKEMSAEKLLDLKWYDAGFTKADLITATDDYNNSTRQPLENFFSDKQYDTWYPAQTEDGLELFICMNGRSYSIEVVSGLRTLKYGARVINHVVRAGKVTIDSFRAKDALFKWILDTDFGQD